MSRLAAAAFVAFGLLMALSGAADLLVPRAHALRWSPAPGRQLAFSPDEISIAFDAPLHRTSYAYVRQTEPSTDTHITYRSLLDPSDPQRHTLLVQLDKPLPDGVYAVGWTARTPWAYFGPWGGEGVYQFAVGSGWLASPAVQSWDEGSLDSEGNGDPRSAALVGGALLILLGLAWPQLSQYRHSL